VVLAYLFPDVLAAQLAHNRRADSDRDEERDDPGVKGVDHVASPR
jgi:hypothetical protein